jgi:chitodextrinase
VPTCGALLLVASCGWGRAADVDDGRSPGAPTGVTAGAGSATTVHVMWNAVPDGPGIRSYEVYRGSTKAAEVPGAQHMVDVTGLRPSTLYGFTVRARDAADNLSPAGAPVRLTTPGVDDGRGTAPTGFTAGSHRAGGAYYLDLSWDPPRTDGVITEYGIRLDGAAATSLVWGGPPPRGRAHHSFYVGRVAGETRRVRLRARLPDGTWGDWSVQRTVSTGG